MFLKDNHTNLPFKLVHLKPDVDFDANTKAHRHNYFELFVFANIGKKHIIDFDAYEVEKQSVHIVIPGCVHLLKRNSFTKGFVLLFSEEFYHTNFTGDNIWIGLLPSIIQNGASVSMNSDRFQIILDLCNHIDSTKDKNIIRSYLHLIFQHIKNAYQQQNKFIETKKNKLAYQFRKLVEKDFYKQHKSDYYAKALNLSLHILNQKTKLTFGKSSTEIIQDRLMLEAKRMLIHYEMSIKEIAYELGYKDPSYFNRVFKTKTKYSPKMFRDKNTDLFNQ